MHETKPSSSKLLPTNAYRKLEPGEVYQPVVARRRPPARGDPLVDRGRAWRWWFCSPPPASTWRCGPATPSRRRSPSPSWRSSSARCARPSSTILENVMVQSHRSGGRRGRRRRDLRASRRCTSTSSSRSWWQIFLACFIGGFLGVVLIIPLRKYFVKDLHGELPFPEATAINNILVTGESTGRRRRQDPADRLRPRRAVRLLGRGLPPVERRTCPPPPCSAGSAMPASGFEVQLHGHRRAVRPRLHHRHPLRVDHRRRLGAGLLVMVPLVYLFGREIGGLLTLRRHQPTTSPR